MKSITILALAILATCAALWLHSHHIIRAEPGLIVIPKRYWSWQHSFVDIRDWTYDDFKNHPPVKQALSAQGYTELLPPDPNAPHQVLRRRLEELAEETERQWLELQAKAREWWNRQLEAAAAYLDSRSNTP